MKLESTLGNDVQELTIVLLECGTNDSRRKIQCTMSNPSCPMGFDVYSQDVYGY